MAKLQDLLTWKILKFVIIVREFHPKAHFLGCQFFGFVSHWFVGPTKEFVEVSPRNGRSSTHALNALNKFLNGHCMNRIPRFGYFLITKCYQNR